MKYVRLYYGVTMECSKPVDILIGFSDLMIVMPDLPAR